MRWLRRLLPLFPLPLLIAAIFCAGQLGLLASFPAKLDVRITPVETADYRSWNPIQFHPVDPALGTAVARETLVHQGLLPSSTVRTAVAVVDLPTATLDQQVVSTAIPSPVTTQLEATATSPSRTEIPSSTPELPPDSTTLTAIATLTIIPSPTAGSTVTPTHTPTATGTTTATASTTATTTITPTATLTGTRTTTPTPTSTRTPSPLPSPTTTFTPTITLTDTVVASPIPSNTPAPSATLTYTPTFTPTATFTATPTATATFTATSTATSTSTATATATITNPSEPNIGLPNGVYRNGVCSPLVLDLNAAPIFSNLGYDFVYYEFKNGANVNMDRIRIEVATSPGGPWFQVFYWGDGVVDTNSNIGQAGYGGGGEPDNSPIPGTNPPLYGSMPYISGILIDVDAVAPAVTYTWMQLSNGCGAEIDAIQPLAAGIPAADFSLSMTVDNPNPYETNIITFTTTITNNGPTPTTITGVQVSDALPTGLTLISAIPSMGIYNSSTGLWTLDLASGASATLALIASVNAGTGGTVITNMATLVGTGGAFDAIGSNNSASTSISVQTALADVAVAKSVNTPTPNEGSTISFSIIVTNNGPLNATNVQVTDLIPAGLTYLTHSTLNGSYDPVSGLWNIGTLTNGQFATLVVDAQVNLGTGGQLITNTATITAADQADPDGGNNSASASITVQSADLAVGKTVDNLTPLENDTVIFTITVTNSGPTSASNIVITDLLPSGLTYQSYTATQGVYSNIDGQWAVGSLGTGANATLDITATVNPGTAGTALINTAAITVATEYDPNSGNNSVDVTINVQP